MWVIELEQGVWLADGGQVTLVEDKALLIKDMPEAQALLKKIRRFRSYKDAAIVYTSDSTDLQAPLIDN